MVDVSDFHWFWFGHIQWIALEDESNCLINRSSLNSLANLTLCVSIANL